VHIPSRLGIEFNLISLTKIIYEKTFENFCDAGSLLYQSI
jgi:hypothetical protein